MQTIKINFSMKVPILNSHLFIQLTHLQMYTLHIILAEIKNVLEENIITPLTLVTP